VKRPEVADAIDPDELTGNDDDAAVKPAQPGDKPQITPDASTPKTPAEDIQMKKALELLRENKQPVQRAA
jgi:hypothetical protein